VGRKFNTVFPRIYCPVNSDTNQMASGATTAEKLIGMDIGSLNKNGKLNIFQFALRSKATHCMDQESIVAKKLLRF